MRSPPLSPTLFIKNRSRLKDRLQDSGLAIVTSNDEMPTNGDGVMGFVQNSDLFYLTGISQPDTLFIFFPSHPNPKFRELLFIKETDEQIVIWEGHKYTKEQAREMSGIQEVYWTHEFEQVLKQIVFLTEVIYLNDNENPRQHVAVESQQGRMIAKIKNEYPLHGLKRLAPIMHQLRMIKQQEEVEAICNAIRITGLGFSKILSVLKHGVYEYELEGDLSCVFIKNQARGFAYSPIIASGSSSCILHYTSNHQMCQAGDLVLLDIGANYANYNADLTRTVPVSGTFSPRQRAVYDAVLRVLNFANEMLRPGTLLNEYNKEVGAYMTSELIGLGLLSRNEVKMQDKDKPLYRKYFMHGTSHHLGLDVHDVAIEYTPIQEGMVLTIEPGIYIREEKMGVRLENNVWIGPDHNINLMNSIPIEADEIEQIMSQHLESSILVGDYI
jgi:Xaa-Pro aminopeptidase